ncbi:MAG: hypothetical protein QOJ84_5571 [Bradyrhizobium sp.]|nr:hypothetical protein [Bradyrhizobium sp.]
MCAAGVGTVNAAAANFCSKCGQRLATPAAGVAEGTAAKVGVAASASPQTASYPAVAVRSVLDPEALPWWAYVSLASSGAPSRLRGSAVVPRNEGYPCCLLRKSLPTGFGPIAIGPACICCWRFLRWNCQAVSRCSRSRHCRACPSHFPLREGSAVARSRHRSSIARQFATSLMVCFLAGNS